jgi:hypothetical protein
MSIDSKADFQPSSSETSARLTRRGTRQTDIEAGNRPLARAVSRASSVTLTEVKFPLKAKRVSLADISRIWMAASKKLRD